MFVALHTTPVEALTLCLQGLDVEAPYRSGSGCSVGTAATPLALDACVQQQPAQGMQDPLTA